MANIDLETLTLLYEGKQNKYIKQITKTSTSFITKMMLLHLTARNMIPSLAKAY